METIKLSQRRLHPSNDDAEDIQHPPNTLNTRTRLAPDAAHQPRIAIGFADIYGSLTTRQLGVISSSLFHFFIHNEV